MRFLGTKGGIDFLTVLVLILVSPIVKYPFYIGNFPFSQDLYLWLWSPFTAFENLCLGFYYHIANCKREKNGKNINFSCVIITHLILPWGILNCFLASFLLSSEQVSNWWVFQIYPKGCMQESSNRLYAFPTVWNAQIVMVVIDYYILLLFSCYFISLATLLLALLSWSS